MEVYVWIGLRALMTVGLLVDVSLGRMHGIVDSVEDALHVNEPPRSRLLLVPSHVVNF